VLLVSGSTRAGSGNTAALVTAAAVAPGRVTAVLYDGLARLPVFNPDDDGDRLPREAAGLREEIAAADAVLFCTPEYAGTLPGSFKNLLDWTVGGGQLYGKPAAWINVAGPDRGQGAQDALVSVLGYVGAVIVEAACRRIPVDRAAVSQDGTISDPRFRAEAAEVWDALLDYLGGR
jgi:chromate reductase, NAD(P)H dehydrogenase (quinone)